MTKPIISVIMTVRNGALYLREALDSLLDQTDANFEIVVIDDGSVDETMSLLDEYHDPRIVKRRFESIGRAAALASAVAMAKGDLVAVLDADDIALPQRLATQRDYLAANPDVALVGSSAIEFDGAREWQRGVISGPQNVRRALGMHNPFFHSSIMFRRQAYDAVGGYIQDGGWGHDKDFLIRMARAFPVDIIAEPLIRYRHHSGQMSISRVGEGFRRRKSARMQLRAARDLRLPIRFWVFPLLSFAYAYLPTVLQPRRAKAFAKRVLLRAFGVSARASAA